MVSITNFYNELQEKNKQKRRAFGEKCWKIRANIKSEEEAKKELRKKKIQLKVWSFCQIVLFYCALNHLSSNGIHLIQMVVFWIFIYLVWFSYNMYVLAIPEYQYLQALKKQDDLDG